MKYILDFDDTVFDTVKFKSVMRECNIAEDSVSEKTFSEIKKQLPNFDIKEFVFSDALAFISKYKDKCEIVTAYLSRKPENNYNIENRKRFQIAKIRLCGVLELLGERHIHLVSESKSAKLADLKQKLDSSKEICVYIDDQEKYVSEAGALGIRTFFMNRKKKFGPFEFMGHFERTGEISSFDELEVTLK